MIIDIFESSSKHRRRRQYIIRRRLYSNRCHGRSDDAAMYYERTKRARLSVQLKPKFHLARHVTSLHDSTRSTCRTRLEERASRAVRQAWHSQNARARHVERVESCRDM